MRAGHLRADFQACFLSGLLDGFWKIKINYHILRYIIFKGSGDNKSLACKCWSNWSKLEQTDIGGQMTPTVGHWCLLKGLNLFEELYPVS